MLAYALEESVIEPEPPPVEIGPIRAAFVEAGLTIVIGEQGVDRHLNDAVPDRPIERETALPSPHLVDAPALDATPVGFAEPMVDPSEGAQRVEGPERLTYGMILGLMRQPRDGNARSGGSSSGRSKKPPKPRKGANDADEHKESTVNAYRLSGLTLGERAYYNGHPGEAFTVLRTLVGRIKLKEIKEPRSSSSGARLKYAGTVHGLADEERAILLVYPIATRTALVEHARARDGARIAKIDGTA